MARLLFGLGLLAGFATLGLRHLRHLGPFRWPTSLTPNRRGCPASFDGPQQHRTIGGMLDRRVANIL